MSRKKQRTDPLTCALPPGGVDSHCHLDGPEFDADREDVLARARAVGLRHLGNVFLGPENFLAHRQYYDAHPEVFFLLGVHPCHGLEWSAAADEAMRRAFAGEPRLKAVGEIGLDFYWDDCPKEVQFQVFTAQLRMARELDKPVVIHCRDAEEDCLMTLEAAGFKDYPVLWHCFGLGPVYAKRIIRNGWYVSIPGPVSYKANTAVREALQYIPADRLMLETDAPYLSPEPWRGKRNEPAHTVFTVRAMAEARGEDAAELWQICGRNACTFFGLSA